VLAVPVESAFASPEPMGRGACGFLYKYMQFSELGASLDEQHVAPCTRAVVAGRQKQQ
jgi:hypothetical protein